ncbi:hypothetical protein J6358_31835, partial [Burkholderia pseudomallei]|nr:hypothetical protein [Burkholderia pseudomallei]
MSTSDAQRAHAARATCSASLSSPLVRGAIAGIVHGVTAAHSLSEIVGTVEGGACVQAHNIVRQSASSPGAHGGVFIDQSPQFVSIGRERRVDAGACA